jgi:hypothetical protein
MYPDFERAGGFEAPARVFDVMRSEGRKLNQLLPTANERLTWV